MPAPEIARDCVSIRECFFDEAQAKGTVSRDGEITDDY